MQATVTFSAPLWLYNGQAAWHFITVPPHISAQLREQFASYARGFRSLKVKAVVNNIEWVTSIFPDTKRNGYLLPVKKAVRTQAGIALGDECKVTLHIIV